MPALTPSKTLGPRVRGDDDGWDGSTAGSTTTPGPRVRGDDDGWDGSTAGSTTTPGPRVRWDDEGCTTPTVGSTTTPGHRVRGDDGSNAERALIVRPELLNLFAGVFGVLVLASAIGAVLKRRVAAGEPHATIDNLNARIKAWWWMVILLGLAFAVGKAGVVVLFAFIAFLCLREFVSLTYTRRGDHWALALAFFFFLPLQFALVGVERYAVYSVLIPVYAFLTMPIFAALSSDTTRFFERAAKVQTALMICVYCISYVPALMTLRIPGFEGGNLLLIAWLVLVVQSSDVLQYVWGKVAGRRRIAPALSPSTTAEGAIGGIGSGCVLGALLAWLTPFSVVQSVGIALLVNLMGFFGGLVMAAIKRDRGVKDRDTLIAGHGGMLDRLGSVIFAAPVYFHVIRLGWEP